MVDDGTQVGSVLDQIPNLRFSFSADGAYDQDGVYTAIAERHPKAAMIVLPRPAAVTSDMAVIAPTQHDLWIDQAARILVKAHRPASSRFPIARQGP